MENNQTISLKRLGLLYKQYYYLNDKRMLLTLGATAGLITFFHTFIHFINISHLGNQMNSQYFAGTFIFAFVAGCLLWTGYAFPSFRTKEKCFNYLIVPASSLEKFLFEFINRILLYIILFPIIYWLFTNLVTWSFHLYRPEYVNYKFRLSDLVPNFSGLQITLAISLSMLFFTLSFTGATYFRVLPIVKTIVAVFILIGAFAGYIYVMVNLLNLEEYHPANNRVLFISNETNAMRAAIIAAILANLLLLTISYFKIKEKEV